MCSQYDGFRYTYFKSSMYISFLNFDINFKFLGENCFANLMSSKIYLSSITYLSSFCNNIPYIRFQLRTISEHPLKYQQVNPSSVGFVDQTAIQSAQIRSTTPHSRSRIAGRRSRGNICRDFSQQCAEKLGRKVNNTK